MNTLRTRSVQKTITKSVMFTIIMTASAGDLMTLLVATDQLRNHPDVLSHSTLNAMETRPFARVAEKRAIVWQVNCEGR
jgi:hypothetical protein